MEKTAYLVLQNGQVFQGKRFGADGEITGEIVFTTAMTGYLETLTDPSYYGQMVVQTFPAIGNYGVISADFESDSSHVKAYIVREWCQEPSNFRCEGTLDAFLKEKNIIGLYDVDTRELTKIIRREGVMNAKITDSAEKAQEIANELAACKICDAVQAVSCKEAAEYSAEDAKHKVVMMDFGTKACVVNELVNRGCTVVKVPYNTTAEQILAMAPNGVVLSNGPADPAENKQVIEQVAQLCKAGVPVFGISLGHQLLALAQGAETYKLKYGHRGANQPVKDIKNNKVFVTAQNHGYAVKADTLPSNAEVTYVNVNDGSCEGVKYNNIPAFSVQFNPEGLAGYCYDEFVSLMEGEH
ncbi:MAG: carbamoyl phosphate synthase small subunit [Oscillospiraceae bacterium]|nr:carbamoyl phosphate synthase small subunit [Oscillospiraceae bacterium]